MLATESTRDTAKDPHARLTGFLYLLTIVTGVFSAFAPRGPAATAASLAATALYVAVTLLLYGLLKPVGKTLALIATLFSLAGCIVGALETLHLAPAQVNSLAFFGVYCLMVGYLIVRSTFLPRAIGFLMAFAGVGWLTFVDPPFGRSLAPYIMIPGMIGEGSLTVWLLARGVNLERWSAQARAQDRGQDRIEAVA